MAQKIVTTKTGEHGTIPVTPAMRHKVWMQIIVSFVLLLSGIFILISPNFLIPHEMDEGTKQFAAGWIGGIIGYWLS